MWTEQDERILKELINKKEYYNKYREKINIFEALLCAANNQPEDIRFGTSTTYPGCMTFNINLQGAAYICFNNVRKLQQK